MLGDPATFGHLMRDLTIEEQIEILRFEPDSKVMLSLCVVCDTLLTFWDGPFGSCCSERCLIQAVGASVAAEMIAESLR